MRNYLKNRRKLKNSIEYNFEKIFLNDNLCLRVILGLNFYKKTHIKNLKAKLTFNQKDIQIKKLHHKL